MSDKLNFRNQIQAESELRDIVGHPSDFVRNKTISTLDDHCRRFIAQSPLLVIATADGGGNCDVSPRGDAPGFVLVLDDKHLAIPDRPGNRRIDSMRNILSNPHVGLFFIIPGLEEILRVNGKACVTQDSELLERMQVGGKVPALAIGVRVEECFVHCAKALKRAQLWNPAAWPPKGELPGIARMMADHANLSGVSEKEVAQYLHESYTQRMY